MSLVEEKLLTHTVHYHWFLVGLVVLCLQQYVYCFGDCCLSFFLSPLCCLSFYLRITPFGIFKLFLLFLVGLVSVYCFGDCYLSFFSVGHCVVCPSSIDGFSLPPLCCLSFYLRVLMAPFGIFKLFLLFVNMFSVMNIGEILLT